MLLSCYISCQLKQYLVIFLHFTAAFSTSGSECTFKYLIFFPVIVFKYLILFYFKQFIILMLLWLIKKFLGFEAMWYIVLYFNPCKDKYKNFIYLTNDAFPILIQFPRTNFKIPTLHKYINTCIGKDYRTRLLQLLVTSLFLCIGIIYFIFFHEYKETSFQEFKRYK